MPAQWIRPFEAIGMSDVPAVGGKNASLGELRRALTPLFEPVPAGAQQPEHVYIGQLPLR